MSTSDMESAYRAAKEMIDENASASEKELMADISSSDVLVVKGDYDRVQDVLDVTGMPYTLVEPDDTHELELDPTSQMLIVNCPGKLPKSAIRRIRDFVEQGGSLFTTDWALDNVLEHAFPGILKFNKKPTADAVVSVSVADHENPMLDGIFSAEADPQWWLEGASYPIKILDREKVQVLVESRELASNWGESPVVVTFQFGKGEVLHMISHYYLQRTELRTERHRQKWTQFATETGSDRLVGTDPSAYAELTTGELESAYTSSKFLRNAVLRSRQRRKLAEEEPPRRDSSKD